MEREKELAKLISVLRRTGRTAMHSEWTGSGADTAAFCVERYNRVLARLKELDDSVGAIFDPLPAESSLTVVALACRQLAAYYEDEVGKQPGGWGDWKGVWADPRFGVYVDKRAFKEFWAKSARDIEDLGEFIRENIEEWFRGRKPQEEKKEGD